MNINCTSNCVYQSDGKCTMDIIPDFPGQSFSSSVAQGNSECPYMQSGSSGMQGMF